MPGYRELAEDTSGPTADATRAAEQAQRGGDRPDAVLLFEAALRNSLAVNPVMPVFLCGRLATLYRALMRYDDEVALLELFRETQVAETVRLRFDARLSKARARRAIPDARFLGARIGTCRPRRSSAQAEGSAGSLTCWRDPRFRTPSGRPHLVGNLACHEAHLADPAGEPPSRLAMRPYPPGGGDRR